MGKEGSEGCGGAQKPKSSSLGRMKTARADEGDGESADSRRERHENLTATLITVEVQVASLSPG